MFLPNPPPEILGLVACLAQSGYYPYRLSVAAMPLEGDGAAYGPGVAATKDALNRAGIFSIGPLHPECVVAQAWAV
jgi:hypothetical protein